MSGFGITDRPDGRGPGSDGEVAVGPLIVVTVSDTVVPALAGHDGCRYVNPPQTHEQAMALVRLLLGCSKDLDGEREWTAPIAGGRRVVTLTEETNR
jgi:hypothetical protein